jgi:hypothetical protein
LPLLSSTMAAESKVYSGSCHCGKNSFSVKVSPPLDSDESKVINCNCSICSKNGYLFVFTDLSDLKWEKGGFDDMKAYKFGSQTLSHYFCTECGGTFASTGSMGGVEKVGMNVRDPIQAYVLHAKFMHSRFASLTALTSISCISLNTMARAFESKSAIYQWTSKCEELLTLSGWHIELGCNAL